jgi:hypothetical protein
MSIDKRIYNMNRNWHILDIFFVVFSVDTYNTIEFEHFNVWLSIFMLDNFYLGNEKLN